ncbi:leukocyte antigen CD37 isoform X2 [Monodelphis domestica]|uniref:leukocyte antigen CD37 isoform X2 n=1 Tax=Monodelphis domestica TaxID=13616 RepID=UPI0024E23935|nr:leukocyte antigen CD37 isoform X2 [Monodelphis domestica]
MERQERSLQDLGTAGTRESEEAGEPQSSEETSGPLGVEEIRTPEGFEETRGPQESEEEFRGPEETELRDPEGSKEIRGQGETEENRDPEETKGIRSPGDTKETRASRTLRRPQGVRWLDEISDKRETSGDIETKDLEENKENSNPEDTKNTRDPERSEARPEETEIRDPGGSEGTRGLVLKISSVTIGESREPGETEKTRTQDSSQEPEIKDAVPSEKTNSSRRAEKTSTRFSYLDIRGSKETRGSERSKETRHLEEPQVKIMAEKGCLSLIKYFLFVFNIFFFVLGSLIFCFGLWILVDKNSFASFLGMSFTPLKVWSYAMAISGIFTGILSFLGCLGALKEIRCLLGLITIGVLIYTQHGSLERKVKLIVLDVIENYHKYPDAYSTAENWDFVQFQLRCCGWDSPQDWWLASSLRPNGSAPSGGERAFTSSPTTRSSSLMSPNSSLMSPSSQTLGPVPRVPCSCQNTSVIMGAPPSPAEVSKVSQPAPGPGAKASRVLPGPGVPGTATRLHSGELCSLPADSSVYQEGCSRSLYTWLHNNLISIVGISLGLGLLEVVALGLTLALLPYARGWDTGRQGMEGESSTAGEGGNNGTGATLPTWCTANRCPSWGAPVPSRLPTVMGRWLPRERRTSRQSFISSVCRLGPQGPE